MTTFAQHSRHQSTAHDEAGALAHVPTSPLPQAPSAPDNSGRQRSQTPLLLLFMCHTNGQARRVEGFVAHTLQHRGNHDAFRVRVIDQAARPDLFARFAVEEVPTVLVVEDKHVVRRLAGNVRPHDLERELADWLK